MSLKEEFHHVVLRCVRGELKAEEVEDWLAGQFQALHDQPDRELDAAANDVYVLIHQHWNQELTADELRGELSDLVAVPAPD